MRAAVWVTDIQDKTEVERLQVYCRLHGHTMVALIHDAAGIASAAQMYAAGDLDVLVVVSRRNLPLPIEIITVEVLTTPDSRSQRRERPRRLHRTRGGGRSPRGDGPP
jgi:hypothetical protein